MPKRRAGRSIATTTMANRVESFITWINTFATPNSSTQIRTPESASDVSVTPWLWHFARRPGGLVVLAIQYGHMRTLISEGYANPQELHQTGMYALVA